MPLSQYSSSFQGLLQEGNLRSVTKGQTIVTTENIRGIFCVKRGFVKRFLIKNDGAISVQGIYGPADCFGMSILSRLLVKEYVYSGSETYYYEALTDAVVYEININDIRNTLLTRPELYKDFFTMQGWHSLSDVWLLENQGLANAQKRVAHIICFYMERYGILTKKGWEFKVPFIQQDLADILDLSRETVSLAINDLRKQKLIKGRRKIIVPSLQALKTYAYS